MTKARSIYITWATFQRRQVSMAPYCGFDLIFMPVLRPTRHLRKALAYGRNAWLTMAMLLRERPEVVWIQLPQVPLLWVALLYRWITKRKPIVIADCHNAMFRPPWSKVPLGLTLLSSCDIVIAHTKEMLEAAVGLGVNPAKLLVVGDPPARFGASAMPVTRVAMPHPWIVFPASFSDDEPISEVIAAARLVPHVAILITGDYKNLDTMMLHATAPANVRFLGFLPREDFDNLLQHCDGVIAFTRLEGLQMSVCGEAIGCNKPMVISDTKALRRLFPAGTVFVNSSDSQDIAAGIAHLFAHHAALTEQITQFHQTLDAEWLAVHGKHLNSRIQTARVC